MIAELKHKEAAWRGRWDVRGHVALEQRAEAVGKRRYSVEEEIKATPAVGLAGLAVKILLAAERFDSFEPDSRCEHIVEATAKDAKRLVGRVLS